jgi:hypothetical protein
LHGASTNLREAKKTEDKKQDRIWFLTRRQQFCWIGFVSRVPASTHWLS